MENLVLAGIVTIVVILIGLRVYYNYRKKQVTNVRPYKSLPSRQAYKLIQLNSNNPDFTILDIRSFEEYKKGHLLKSINIDFNNDDFRNRIEDLSKEGMYLIYCNNGIATHKSAANAMDMMEEMGFKKVVAMHKGIVAWKRNKLPIVMGED